jgi:heterodisulfide reductase subunit A
LKHPHKIAWIQCNDLRFVLPEANHFCSSVCYDYTQKLVILTKDHDPDAECTVFFIDIRSHGKDFERFFQRMSKLPKTRFIRSAVTIVGENPVNKNLILRYATFDVGTVDEEFDMFVLSIIGLNPPKANKKFSEIMGIELNEYGFRYTNETSPVETNINGN